MADEVGQDPLASDRIPPPTSAVLAYSTGRTSRSRPGKLTAVGILLILFGALGSLTNLIALPFLVVWLTTGIARQAAPSPTTMPVSLPAPPEPAVEPYIGDLIGDHGLHSADREIVREHIRSITSHNDEMDRNLDALLAEFGAMMFDDAGDPLTPDSVAASIRGLEVRGRRVVQRPRQDAELEADGSFTFSTRHGDVKVDRVQATFTPAGHSGPPHVIKYPLYIDPNGVKHYASLAIDDAVQQVRRKLSFKFTPIQAGAYAMELRQQGKDQRVTSNRLIPNVRPVHESGAVIIDGPRTGLLWITPNGRVVHDLDTYRTNPATGLPRPPPSPGPVRRGMASPSGAAPVAPLAAGIFVFEAALSLVLGVVAVVVGISLLANARYAFALAGFYATVKIAATVFATIVSLWMQGQMPLSPLFPASSAATVATIVFTLVVFGLSCALPIVLLWILGSADAQAFYESIGAHPSKWTRWAGGWQDVRLVRACLSTVLAAALLLVTANIAVLVLSAIGRLRGASLTEHIAGGAGSLLIALLAFRLLSRRRPPAKATTVPGAPAAKVLAPLLAVAMASGVLFCPAIARPAVAQANLQPKWVPTEEELAPATTPADPPFHRSQLGPPLRQGRHWAADVVPVANKLLGCIFVGGIVAALVLRRTLFRL